MSAHRKAPSGRHGTVRFAGGMMTAGLMALAAPAALAFAAPSGQTSTGGATPAGSTVCLVGAAVGCSHRPS